MGCQGGVLPTLHQRCLLCYVRLHLLLAPGTVLPLGFLCRQQLPGFTTLGSGSAACYRHSQVSSPDTWVCFCCLLQAQSFWPEVPMTMM